MNNNTVVTETCSIPGGDYLSDILPRWRGGRLCVTACATAIGVSYYWLQGRKLYEYGTVQIAAHCKFEQPVRRWKALCQNRVKSTRAGEETEDVPKHVV
ncbi:hypothetical protein J6590_053135 [Homalodisca vitripennis]|nr:hypothetical protein J6590_053135 [Homalodisca vitripennis]